MPFEEIQRRLAKHQVNSLRNDIIKLFKEMIKMINDLDVPENVKKIALQIPEKGIQAFANVPVQEFLNDRATYMAKMQAHLGNAVIMQLSHELREAKTESRLFEKVMSVARTQQGKLYQMSLPLDHAVQKARDLDGSRKKQAQRPDKEPEDGLRM